MRGEQRRGQEGKQKEEGESGEGTRGLGEMTKETLGEGPSSRVRKLPLMDEESSWRALPARRSPPPRSGAATGNPRRGSPCPPEGPAHVAAPQRSHRVSTPIASVRALCHYEHPAPRSQQSGQGRGKWKVRHWAGHSHGGFSDWRGPHRSKGLRLRREPTSAKLRAASRYQAREETAGAIGRTHTQFCTVLYYTGEHSLALLLTVYAPAGT